jgi:hypothetical protein
MNWKTTPGPRPGTTIVHTVCPNCPHHETKDLTVLTGRYAMWIAGAHIQDAFKDLSEDDRERIITGTCEKCWAAMGALDEGDEDE